MLKYIEDKLTVSGKIINADTLIQLTTDINCDIFAKITLSNGNYKFLEFVKENTYYKGRLLFTEEDLNYLDNVTLSLILVSSTTKNSNEVLLDLDTIKIKQSIKVSKSKELLELRKDLSKLTNIVNDVLTNKIVYKTNLSVEQTNIVPGMIPVAINEQGLCMFKYPFIDHVTEINGQKTVNNAILITAKDIPIEQTDVATAIKAHTDAIKELNNLMKTISSELKVTKNKVADIEKALLLHTDSSII